MSTHSDRDSVDYVLSFAEFTAWVMNYNKHQAEEDVLSNDVFDEISQIGEFVVPEPGIIQEFVEYINDHIPDGYEFTVLEQSEVTNGVEATIGIQPEE